MEKLPVLRIIDKKTLLFIRDDFTFNVETEIGLDVSPDNEHPYKQRKWDTKNNGWVEASGTIV